MAKNWDAKFGNKLMYKNVKIHPPPNVHNNSPNRPKAKQENAFKYLLIKKTSVSSPLYKNSYLPFNLISILVQCKRLPAFFTKV